ncbi:MAG: DinB family protein, partial [Gemmatimonadaceae bacterium]
MTLTQPRFQVVPSGNYSPLISSLVAMLEHSRESVLDSVAGLSVAALDHQHDEKANPIGAMLAHMAALEWYYNAVSIDGAQPSGQDWAEWGAFLRLTPATWVAARGRTLEEHVERLQRVRTRTLSGLASKDDAW